MNGSSAAASTPMQPPISGNLTYNSKPGIAYPGEDAVKQVEYDQEFRETFCKTTLRMNIQGYFAGKYTKRYIDTYLEFMHLSGWISNLDYLDFKNSLAGE